MVGRTRGGRWCVGSGFVTVAGVLWDRGVSAGTQGVGQQRGEMEQREVEVGEGWGWRQRLAEMIHRRLLGRQLRFNTATNQVFIPLIELVKHQGAWPACGRGRRAWPEQNANI